jgi:hypothetical protein
MEVRNVRSFSRINFDMATRLVKAYRAAVGRRSHLASSLWKYVSLPHARTCIHTASAMDRYAERRGCQQGPSSVCRSAWRAR